MEKNSFERAGCATNNTELGEGLGGGGAGVGFGFVRDSTAPLPLLQFRMLLWFCGTSCELIMKHFHSGELESSTEDVGGGGLPLPLCEITGPQDDYTLPLSRHGEYESCIKVMVTNSHSETTVISSG